MSALRRSCWLAAVRLLTAALGAAWIVWDRNALEQPLLAALDRGNAERAIDLADTEPLLVPRATPRADIVAQATARDAERRYDPILVVDKSWRLVEAITIEELLQPLPLAAEG